METFRQKRRWDQKSKHIVETAKKSIGLTIALYFAKYEMNNLLDQYEMFHKQLEELDLELEKVVKIIPGANEMMDITGLGVTTVISEIGDFKKYGHYQQLINLAGLSLRENSSGKFKGQTTITKRGRSKLRRALYLAVRPLVAHNPTFKALHHYYTNRPDKPLKKQQSLIALCCKLLRVLFVIGQRECPFDGSKLLQGIP